VTDLYEDAYTEPALPRKLVGKRVRVLDDELNPKGELGAWFVTALDPRNTAHVLVAKVDEFRVQIWSVHNGQLRIRP
jgi:hypothetical protein